MARITAQQAGGQNIVAFLDAIAGPGVEDTAMNPATLDDGYDILVSGKPISLNDGKGSPIPPGLVTSIGIKNRFNNAYVNHPNVLVQVNASLKSSAAGRYQIMTRWWPAYQKQLNLPDFGPISQDLYAIQQIREQKAISLLLAGRFFDAVNACSGIWASLPGTNQIQGQNKASPQLLVAHYTAAGGVVTA